MSRHPDRTVAIVNGLIVMSLPLALWVLTSLFRVDSNTGVTVRPPGSHIQSMALNLFSMEAPLLPFATLAGWRSSVYARRWRDEQDQGWRGVAEAGACGLSVALVVLAPGIATKPAEALPYIISYGGAALVAGLLVGLLLRMTALLVLKLDKSAAT